ncbi:MAG: hypothetical protein JSU63_05410 [Phycisphaerales bacterium]|nr:MAG: hypothetical protein JSU63_05410 [Phycisphaerales bacterium]
MTEVLTFSTGEVEPDRDSVLQNQGIPEGATVTDEIERLLKSAIGAFHEHGKPVGMTGEISHVDFGAVYQGEGRNEDKTPVGDIFRRAERLALFVVTLGERICARIDELFRSSDYALACMLDSVASAAADKTAEVLQERYADSRSGSKTENEGRAVLRYSPGYCGWHISGQRGLFEFLHPEEIGVSLKESFLMQPLKSVSGVLIAGAREIHEFEDSYSFCAECATRGCRERIRALYRE